MRETTTYEYFAQGASELLGFPKIIPRRGWIKLPDLPFPDHFRQSLKSSPNIFCPLFTTSLASFRTVRRLISLRE